MNMRSWVLIFGTIIISLMFNACRKDEIQAENSLEGIWDIVTIHSTYGEFSENGSSPTENISESGQLGTFDFMQEDVDFNFTRNDTLFSGSGSWDIETQRVNAGFSKVTEFTLTIDDHFLFDVFLGDGTKNSEKNAISASFHEIPTNGIGVSIELMLEKR